MSCSVISSSTIAFFVSVFVFALFSFRIGLACASGLILWFGYVWFGYGFVSFRFVSLRSGVFCSNRTGD